MTTLWAAAAAHAEPRFGAPFTVGETKKAATYLSIAPAADGGAVIATGGHAALNDDLRGHLLVSRLRADGRFGPLRQMKVRGQPCGLATGGAVGPLFIAAGSAGRFLSCENWSVDGKAGAAAIYFDSRGKRMSRQLLGRGKSTRAGAWSANERGDAVLGWSDEDGRAGLLFSRGGGRLRAIARPPETEFDRSPALVLGPAGQLVATYNGQGQFAVARRSSRGKWSALQTIITAPEDEFHSDGGVRFAPNGNAAAIWLPGGPETASGPPFLAWARGGRAFGPARQLTELDPAPPTGVIVRFSRAGATTLFWSAGGSYYAATSARPGVAFRPAWSFATQPAHFVQYDAMPVPGGGAVVAWHEQAADGSDTIRAVTVDSRGRPGPLRTVDSGGPDRAYYGAKLIATRPGRVVLLWNDDHRPGQSGTVSTRFRAALLKR